AKQRLMMLSSPSEVRFATEWITGDLGLPVCPALAGDVYAAYLRWCRTNGESRPRPSNHFHGSLAHLSGWEKKKARVFPSDHAVWAILTLYILYLLTPWSLILSIPWVFCVLSGGVYFGQHYVVDYIAGILVAIICIVGSNQLILRKNENQKSTT
ncbi:MAG: putative primase/helicase, partial [Patescibacteria group bacterium]|nr:putative primase/helicase [Patescibacteria group bacterium]